MNSHTVSRAFAEPTRSLELRWGRYRPRYVAAIVLLLGGGLLLQLASAYTLGFLIGGTVASFAGWIVVPAAGWRRSTALLPGFLGAVSVLNGAESGSLVALAVASWLLVRHRPPRSYLVVAIPVLAALASAVQFPDYAGRPVVTAVLLAAVVGSAWLARSLAAWMPPRIRRPQRPDIGRFP